MNLYNNFLYNRVLANITKHESLDMEKRGLKVGKPMQFKTHLESEAKFAFWLFVLILAAILFGIVRRFL